MIKKNTLFTLIMFLTIFTLGVSVPKEKKIIGTYDQVSINMPSKIKASENDLKIIQDKNSSKKIWIENLFPDNFYAILASKHSNGETYSIPKQKNKTIRN